MLDGVLDAIHLAALGLHLTHCLFVHSDVTIDHHLFEENEILHSHDLLQQALVDSLLGSRPGQNVVLLGDTKVLDICFELLLNKTLKFRVHLGVLETILFRVFENDAVLLNKANDWIFPHG